MDLIQTVDQWIASLHPHLAGVSSVQLVSVLVLSWLGGRVMTHESHSCPLCDHQPGQKGDHS